MSLFFELYSVCCYLLLQPAAIFSIAGCSTNKILNHCMMEKSDLFINLSIDCHLKFSIWHYIVYSIEKIKKSTHVPVINLSEQFGNKCTTIYHGLPIHKQYTYLSKSNFMCFMGGCIDLCNSFALVLTDFHCYSNKITET